MTKAQLQKEYEAQKAENKALKERLAQQELIISKLQKMIFGPKSERFVNPALPNQISLFAQEQAAKQAELVEKQRISYERNKPRRKPGSGSRIPLPEDLPRIDIILEPEEDISGLIKIDEEVTEVLDIIPPEFRVIRLIRPKYAKPEAKTEDIDNPIIIAPMSTLR